MSTSTMGTRPKDTGAVADTDSPTDKYLNPCQQMRVLVVEPSPVHRRALSNAIAPLGYGPIAECVSISEARTAIERTTIPRSSPFELIILNWAMPDRVALPFLKWLRSRASYESTPVLALSDWGFPKEIAAARAAGVADFVVRPIPVEVLQRRVDRLLSLSPQRFAA